MNRNAKTAATIGAIICLVGALRNTERFFQAYLFASFVFVGIAVGCLGLFLLYRLVGGAWGRASLPVIEAGVKTLPWAALLFAPVLLGMHYIYPWTHTEHIAHFPHKVLFFNIPFFALRSAFYFSLWCWLAHFLRKTSTETSNEKRQAIGALGLIAYVMSVSFASFDWIMSLEPHWASSIYGAMIMVGCLLSAFAFIVVIRNWQETHPQGWEKIPTETLLDLGNLILAFVMLWAYMALSQYLIIWSANLPEEIHWYLARQNGGWQGVVTLLVLCQFAAPFFLLLVRKRKQKLESLAVVAWGLLLVRMLDVYWLVMPAFMPGKLRFHYLDAGTLLLTGGLWTLSFYKQLKEASH